MQVNLLRLPDHRTDHRLGCEESTAKGGAAAGGRRLGREGIFGHRDGGLGLHGQGQARGGRQHLGDEHAGGEGGCEDDLALLHGHARHNGCEVREAGQACAPGAAGLGLAGGQEAGPPCTTAAGCDWPWIRVPYRHAGKAQGMKT